MIHKIGQIFKRNDFSNMAGLAQIPLMIGLLIMAVAIPVATKLMQQGNLDNRGKAAYCDASSCDTGCRAGTNMPGTCVNGSCQCGTPPKPTSVPATPIPQSGGGGGTSCVGENGWTYQGSGSCCSGLQQANCTGSGSFATCQCVKPALNPTDTPAIRTCTVRSCSNYKCVETTVTQASSVGCSPSSCTMGGSECGTAPTSGGGGSSTGCNAANAGKCGTSGGCAVGQKCAVNSGVYSGYQCVPDTTCTQPTPTLAGDCGQLTNRNSGCGCSLDLNCASGLCISGKCQTNSACTINSIKCIDDQNYAICGNGTWSGKGTCQLGMHCDSATNKCKADPTPTVAPTQIPAVGASCANYGSKKCDGNQILICTNGTIVGKYEWKVTGYCSGGCDSTTTTCKAVPTPTTGLQCAPAIEGNCGAAGGCSIGSRCKKKTYVYSGSECVVDSTCPGTACLNNGSSTSDAGSCCSKYASYNGGQSLTCAIAPAACLSNGSSTNDSGKCCSKIAGYDGGSLICMSSATSTLAPTKAISPTVSACKAAGGLVTDASQCCNKQASYQSGSLTCDSCKGAGAAVLLESECCGHKASYINAVLTCDTTCKANGTIVSAASECCSGNTITTGNTKLCYAQAVATPTPGDSVVANTYGCGGAVSQYLGGTCNELYGKSCSAGKLTTVRLIGTYPNRTCWLDCDTTCVGGGGGSTTGAVPTSSYGGGGGGNGGSAATPTSRPSCNGAPQPDDVCAADRLKIKPQCLNGGWDYNEQLCGADQIIETCGGILYCCPTSGSSWTTDTTKCPNAMKCTQCANHPDWKINGDANCDGTTDINDIAAWRSEFISGDLGGTKKTDWKADFNCDGVVDINDASLWRQKFILTL